MAKFKIDTSEAREELKSLIAELKTLRESASGVVQPAKKSIKDFQTEIEKLSKSTKDYEGRLIKLEGQLKKNSTATNKMTSSAKKATAGFKGMLGGVKSLIAAFGIVSGIQIFADAIKNTFTLIKKLDSLKFAMKAIVKTSKAFSENMSFLSRITKAYGAEIVATTERYINFLAAAKQSKVSLKDTQNIFETFTKVAGVLGKSTDDLRGIFLALEQMLSKGKVTTEELRRQLGERLPGAMGIMATSLGVTIPQLDKMLKKGEVLSAVVLPEFARQVEIAFGITNVTKVKTLTASWIRMKNKFVELVDDFKNGKGVIKTLIGTFDFLTRNLGELISATLLAVKAFVSYKVIIMTNIALTKLMAIITELLATKTAVASIGVTKLKWAMLNLNKVLKANAIGIIVVAFTGLIWVMKKLSVSALKTSGAFIKQNKSFVITTEKALQTKDSLLKMADAYDKLKEKGKLSKDEQIEFNRILKAFKDNMPDVITSTDNYGVAIEANTTKLKENLKVQRELAVLRATQKNEDLEKQLKKLTKEYQNFNEETFQAGALTKEEEKKSLLLMVDKNNEFKLSIQNLKDQIKLNKDIISGQDIINKKTKDVQDLLQSIRDKNEKERLAKIRNIHNLKEEIKLLVAKREFIDKDSKGSKEILDNIAKEIKAKQKLIEIIKRSGKLGIGDGKNKEFADQSAKLRVAELQGEILNNKRILDDDNATWEAKIKAAIDNSEKLKEINALTADDIIYKLEAGRKKEIANMSKSGAKKVDIDKFYNGKILTALQNAKNEQLEIEADLINGLDAIGKKKLSNLIKIIKEKGKTVSQAEIKELKSAKGNAKKINAIKKKYAKIGYQIQIDEINNFLSSLKLPDEIKDKLKEFMKELQGKIAGISNASGGETEKEKMLKLNSELLDISQQFANSIVNIFNAISDRKIEAINAEINAEQEKYDELSRLASDHYNAQGEFIAGNARQKDLIETEGRLREKKLQKEKLKEERKAAKLQKAAAIADIAVTLAQTLMAIQLAGIKLDATIPGLGISYRLAQTAIAIGTAATQTSAVLAAPIPKFKDGGTMKETGLAMINDGGVQEFVQRGDDILTTTKKNALVSLKSNDIVYKDYDDMRNNIDLINIINQGNAINQKEMDILFKGIENSIERGFSKAKINVNNNMPSLNINDELWRMQQHS